ncbi:MAG: PAS domain-containing protein [Thomasclavelia ramosa]
MIGYTKEQFKSERYELKSYMHPEDLKRAKQIVHKLRNSKESVVFEGRVYTVIKKNVSGH